MSLFRRIFLRLRAVLGRGRLAREMDNEMREHLELATERYLARGLSPTDARAAARREFGNLPMIEESARAARGARWVDALAADIRFAFRYFGRHKATTTLIVVVLALSTGANTLVFSMIQAQFLRPAAGVRADPAHVRFWVRERATLTTPWETRGFTLPELETLAKSDLFADVAGWYESDVILQGDDSIGAYAVGAQFVTPNYFSTLRVSLAAGAGFVNKRLAPSQSADLTAIMSHATALRLYGDANSAIGREILVNDMPLRLVGVAPPRFQGVLRGMDEPAIWIPLGARADIARVPHRWLTENAALTLFARLARGVSREKASALTQQVVANSLPDSAMRVGMSRRAQVISMYGPPPGSDDRTEMILTVTVVITVGVLILLVAWMNVSSLMVAAAVGRRHEIAVRLSLGASRARLLRQLVTESTMLALTGAAMGLVMAWWLLTWQLKAETGGFVLAPDAGTFVFVLVMALATGILFGLSPALHATRGAVATAVRDSGTGASSRSRLQRGFVVAQIALSQPLLVFLGTMLTLAINENRTYSPRMSGHVITVRFRPLTRYGGPVPSDPIAAAGPRSLSLRRQALDSLFPRIAGQPGVIGAVPQTNGFARRRVVVTDRRPPNADSVPSLLTLEGTAPGWFAVVDAPIILGRDVSWQDTAAVDYPIVIGADLARVLWGDVSPIGRTLASPAMPQFKQDSISLTVVGVYHATDRLPGLSSSWQGGGHGEISTRVFTAREMQWRRDGVLVRTRGLAAPYMPELYRYIREQAPSLPVASMQTLAQIDEEHHRETLRISLLMGAGGVLAMLLASLGLYGVVSLAVRQRVREIGIRIAVGATPASVQRSFLRSGVRECLVALAIGLPLSIAALKVGMNQGIVLAPEVNPWLIGLVIAPVLLAVAVAATWMPARRASLVDPATTLRTE